MRHTHDFPFGATVLDANQTRFRIWAPSTPTLELAIDGTRRAMDTEADGWHSLTVAAPAGTRYQYVMPDGLHFADPASRMQDQDVHGPSVVVDPKHYEWRNAEWRGRPWHEMVLYELHPGLMGGFRGIEDHLPELQRLGINAIELMPINDFPGNFNWGYDGVLAYAPDRSYGTPEELKSLIDAAHGRGIAVFLDVVYNHFGPDGAYIHVFAREFFREDLHTPWGAAIDFRRSEVRDFFIENTLYWLQEYRFDGLRFDAVGAITEEDFLLDLTRLARERVETDRHIALVAEHEFNRAPLLGGPPRFDAQWTDDFHHVMHVLLTGESEGYYDGFQDATNQLRRILAEGFAYQGETPPRSTTGRGDPSGHLPTTSFVTFLQNHDQIGNRAMGERLSQLAPPDAIRAATALLMLTPFVPMIFMGEEYASTSPFLFFTDHHDELADMVRDGRRNEFQHFSGFKDAAKRALIPDPNAQETFAASAPEPTDPTQFDWMRDVIALRSRHVTPNIPGCRTSGAEVLGDRAVRAGWTMADGRQLIVALNLGDGTVDPKLPSGETIHVEGRSEPAALGPRSFVALIAA